MEFIPHPTREDSEWRKISFPSSPHKQAPYEVGGAERTALRKALTEHSSLD